MIEVTKQTCKAYSEGRFFEGDCEFCLNAYDCEQLRFSVRESNRKPTDDWLIENYILNKEKQNGKNM